MLTTPIPLVTTQDPIGEYVRIRALIPPGAKYRQEFDYVTAERPSAAVPKYLEELYPHAGVIDADGDTDSWQISQGMLGACGTFAKIAAYAAIPKDNAYALENGIYPLTPSDIGLYFVRVTDPKNPLGTTWIAIDSQVPCAPGGKSDFIYVGEKGILAPALLMKAAATMRGGCFDEITNSARLKQTFSWFPSTTIPAINFGWLKEMLQQGGMCITSFKQQYDAAGVAITPPGVVYGHAFAIVDAIEVANSDKTISTLVRVENPWGGGADYVSEFADDAPYWADHPEVAQKVADSRQTGGNFWVSWAQLTALAGESLKVTVPLPLPSRPHVNYFRHEFDGSIVLNSDWPTWTRQLFDNTPADRRIKVKLDQSTTLFFDVSWLNGSGPRHTNLKVTDMTGKQVGQFVEEIWWGGSASRYITLPAGEFLIFPCTRSTNTDRGTLQAIIYCSTPFELKIGLE